MKRLTWSSVVLALVLFPVSAFAALTIEPITWNIIGLDSNNVNVGPNNFPVGARVCSNVATTNVTVQFVWDSTNSYVDLRPGSLSTFVIPSIAAGSCQDAYFEVTVQRNTSAFDSTRRYHITATDSSGTVSTPTPREVYVERLISQNRNSINDVLFGTSTLDLVSVPAGGTMDLVVGNTYVIRLNGGTATQGYEQFEQFINFPNTIFRILSVSTTYSAENAPHIVNPHKSLYADACVWDNDPNSPTYRACVGGDNKAGGQTVVTDYTITVVAGGGTSQPLNTLLYDFSGSSFHYNSDYQTAARVANIINPASVTIAKNFSPDPTNAGGVSTLTFTLANSNSVAVSDVNFVDNLPVSPGAMVVAATPGVTTNGCGTATVNASSGTISVSNVTIAGNSTCTIKVNVTVPVVGTYTNTTNNLFIGTANTGNNATDTLMVNNAPPPPAPVCGLTMAQWTVPNATTANPPDLAGGLPTTKAGDVATATVAAGIPANTDLANVGSGDSKSWQTWGYGGAGQYIEFVIDTSRYSSVQLAFAMRNASPANGPTQVAVTANTGSGFTAVQTINLPPGVNTFQNYNVNLTGLTSTTGNTTIRLTGTGANNNAQGSSLDFDNMTFIGCVTPLPPTISKVFSPNPVAVGAPSTLTFTVTNPNSGIGLTGIQFTDTLPAGVTVGTATTPVCGGTLSTTAPGTISFTGGSRAAGANCNIAIPVTVTTAGPHDNISSFISSTEGGTNTGPTGVATASIRAVAPPVISKLFETNPMVEGGRSTLTFTIVNPNSDDALSSVAFTDVLPTTPGAMVIASPPNGTFSPTCGTPAFNPVAGAGTITFSGGTIPGGATCVVSVDITAPADGTYNNTSGNVSHVINAATVNGNTASASLTVTNPAPAIAILKRVSSSSSGPWVPFETVSTGSQVHYRFWIENTGDVPLSSITLTDPNVNVSSCNASLTGVTLAVPSAANENHIFTCSVGPVTTTAGQNTNTAQVQGTYNATTVNDSSQAVYGTTALLLEKLAAPSTYTAAGNVITYTYTVTNTGFAPLLGPVTVTDDKVTVGTCGDLTLIGDNDNYLDPNEQITCSRTYTITAADVTAKSVTNTATAAADGVNSNSDSATVTLGPQLSVTKNAAPATFTAGGSGSYTVTVTNIGGTATSADITIADNLPSGITLSSATGTNWSCTGTTALTCTFTGTLAANANTVLTLNVNVGASATSGDNTATASGGGDPGCPAATRCSGSVVVTVGSSADLAVTKTNGVTSVAAGGTTAYTITVTNNGPSPVTGAILSDPAVTGLAKTSVTCSATPGQCTAPPTVAQLESGTFALPALNSGQTYQLTVNANVTAASGSVTNTATVNPPAGTTDPTPANNTASDTDPVDPVADLAVTKTNGVTSVAANGTTVYTITVTNNGPSSVTGAILSDPAAAGLTKTSVSCSATPGQCTAPPTVAQLESGTFALPALASGQTYQLTVNANVTVASGSVTNTATVAVPAGTTDPVPGNNSASDTDPVNPAADLAITKTNGVTSVAAGGTTVYTITVTNNGPSSVTGAILSDPAATGLVKTAVTCSATPGQCAAPPTVAQLESGTFALPALASGQTYQLTVNANVTAASGSVTNTATVNPPADTADPTPANNTASDTDPVDPVADLAVTKTNGVTSVAANGTTVYTITVTNNGPSPVTGAILSDPAATGLSKTSVTCSATPGQCTAPPTVAQLESGTFALPALASGQTYQLTVNANVTVASGSVTNTATVAVPAGTTDPVPGNNSSSDTDPVDPAADLAITKTNGVTSVAAGGTTTYTITVTNNGPSSVTGAILSDPAVTGLTKTSVACSATPGQCTAPPTVAQLESGTFALPALASGQTYQLTVNANVTATSGSVTNTATVNPPAGTADPTPGNNTASDTDPVDPVADLAVTKTNGVTSVAAGGTTTYTITVTNNGPSSVTGATLSDPAATGLAKTSVTCSATPGQCTAPPTVAQLESGTFALPALASGQTYQLTVNASVTATSGSVTNTATVNPPAGTTDPVPGNNTASDTDPVDPVADLAVTKTNGVTSVAANGTTVYTITVTNNGPSSVTGAILSDPAATGLTKTSVACSATPGQCTAPPTVAQLESGTFALPALASGQTYQLTVNANVTATSGSVTNTATVAVPAGTTDPVPGNNSASDTDPINPAADLAVTKTNGVTSVAAGGTTTYTITVTNNGPSSVTGAVLSDPAATGLAKTSVTCSATPGQCTAPPTVAQLESGTFALPALASGQTYQLTVNASVTAASGSVTNTATVTLPPGTADPVPGNNTASDTDPVDPVADLAVTKTNGVTSVAAGGTTVYTITVTNNGPSPVTGAILSDPAATGLTKTSVTCSATPGQCAAPPTVAQLESGTFALPALSSGQTYQLTVNANVTATSGSVTNTATVAVPAGTTDPVPANNSASDTDPINPAADLAVTKTNGAASVNAGGTTTYTLTVTNNGPSSVTGAVLSDPAATGLTKTSVTCSATPGQCTAPPTVAQLESGTFALPALASGQTYQLTVNANVTATSGSVTNTATVTLPPGTADPVPGNNTATDTDPVNPVADLSITKSNAASGVSAGGTTTYTITVTNNGPSSVTGAILSDPAAAGLTKTAVSCSGTPGQCTAPPTVAQLESGTFALPALASGQTYQLTVNANVTATSGSVTNTATVNPPAGVTDPTPGNNTGSDTDPVGPLADLSVVKTLVTTPPYTAGQSITYSIVVSNAGPSSATNVVVTDTPANLTITGVAGGGCVTFPCTIASLAAGANVTITVTATITAPGAFTNAAAVDGDQPDPDPTDDTDSTDDSTNSADVSVVKTLITAGPYSPGQSITYSIVVANAGPSTATGVQVTDTPANLTITSVSGGCSTLPCTIPSIAAGGSSTLTVTATITAAGAFDNVATANGIETDPSPLNNIDDDGNDGQTGTTVDLAITKTISTTSLSVGQTFDYTLVVVNNGPGGATNVTVNDPLPANFSLISATSTQGTCTGTATVNCAIGAMANGATVTITLRGAVTAAGSLANTATVQATETETVVANNTSSISAQVGAAIPTVGEWGLILLAAGLALAALFMSRFQA